MTTPKVKQYIGRFAPSPTGPMHLGTLVAAMASYLDAKHNNGQWLLRLEDLDPPREIPGSAKAIITTLEAFGFEWNGEILFQSQRNDAYQHFVEQLINNKLAYACDCSRKMIVESNQANSLSKSNEMTYNGHCRHRELKTEGNVAIRVLTEDRLISFQDRIYGEVEQNLQQLCGDFVIKRKDSLFAYQLAVVVDDNFQGVNQIVRGADLLNSTTRQIHLQQKLGLNLPAYAHFPLLLDDNGEKFSKSSNTGEILDVSLSNLINSWHYLGQQTANEVDFDHFNDFWHWAIQHWDISRVVK